MINEYSRTELLIGSENMEKLKKHLLPCLV